MLKMPHIHYIDVNSNEQRQQDITVLTLYVSGTSLACLIMICSLLDVTHKEHNDEIASFVVLKSNLGLY
jgi:hypothetical protein